MKNNLWNRIFHSKALEAYKKEVENSKLLIGLNREMIHNVRTTSSLPMLIELHKKLWKLGYDASVMAPCPYGHFRTDDIANLNMNNVYLGDIYGLFTHTAQYWEDRKHAPYGVNGYGLDGDTKLYDLVLHQYQDLLVAGIRAAVSEANFFLVKATTKGYNTAL